MSARIDHLVRQVRGMGTAEEAARWLEVALRSWAFGDIVNTSPTASQADEGHPESLQAWERWFDRNRPGTGAQLELQLESAKADLELEQEASKALRKALDEVIQRERTACK